MGVLRDWYCKAHSWFESDEEHARCPHGCRSVTRAFRQPPGVSTGLAKRTDRIAEFQMRSMGVTDMSNAHGRTVAENNRRKNWGGDMPDMRPHTVEVGKDLRGTLQAQGVPLTDASTQIGHQSTVREKTRAYVDPRGDPK